MFLSAIIGVFQEMHAQFREGRFDESFPVKCSMFSHPPHAPIPFFVLLIHMLTGQNVSLWERSILVSIAYLSIYNGTPIFAWAYSYPNTIYIFQLLPLADECSHMTYFWPSRCNESCVYNNPEISLNEQAHPISPVPPSFWIECGCDSWNLDSYLEQEAEGTY